MTALLHLQAACPHAAPGSVNIQANQTGSGAEKLAGRGEKMKTDRMIAGYHATFHKRLPNTRLPMEVYA